MKILTFVIAFALFLASFLAFAYSFAVPEVFAPYVFFAGIIMVTLSLMIPTVFLARRD